MRAWCVMKSGRVARVWKRPAESRPKVVAARVSCSASAESPLTPYAHAMATTDRLAFAALLLGAIVAGLATGCSSEGNAPPDGETAPPSAAAGSTAAAGTTAARSAAAADPPTTTDRGRSVEERIADASLAARVKTALVETRSLRPFDFDPRVTGERVTLAGNVGTREQGRTAAEVAAEVDGVDDVLNRLTVSGQRVAWNEGADDESDGSSASGSRQPVAAAEQQQKQGTAGAGGDATAGGGGTYHTVKAGESLWAIASEYGTSVSRVKELNNLRSNSLQAGERLLVEEGDGASSDGATVADASGAQQESDASSSSEEEETAGGEKTSAYYVVKRGDSLWGIAQKNGLSVAKLKELNELSSSDLMPGDRLRVE